MYTTHFAESSSEWAPHQSVYDGVDARVETAEGRQPFKQVQRSWQIHDLKQGDCGFHRQPADRERGHNRKTGQYQTH